MKVEIEIPDPPEGWVFDKFRQAVPGERRWDGGGWMECTFRTVGHYLVCVKVKPQWEPSPELVAVLQPGWVAIDSNGDIYWYGYKPTCSTYSWDGSPMLTLNQVKRELLPPSSIPWDQCCFKIGEPE
jgi:hypothetical protein